ncbi:MAG TPA: hypothetical protein VGG75_28045 [Trebonia sp.]
MLLGIERAADPALSQAYGVAEFIAVRRERAGVPVSLEVSLVPAAGMLADLPARLVDHVVSLLDPAHFRFHLRSGAR